MGSNHEVILVISIDKNRFLPRPIPPSLRITDRREVVRRAYTIWPDHSFGPLLPAVGQTELSDF